MRGKHVTPPLCEISPNTLAKIWKDQEAVFEWSGVGFSKEYLEGFKRAQDLREAHPFDSQFAGGDGEDYLSGSSQRVPFPTYQYVSPKPSANYSASEDCSEEVLPKASGGGGSAQAHRQDVPVDSSVAGGGNQEAQKGIRTILIPSSLVKNIEDDYAQRALVGMIFGPRPPIEVLRTWIKQNWGAMGLEVTQTQALRNNSYIFLMKTPEMALQAIAAGQWMVRNSPMGLFKWYPGFKLEGGNHIKYPVWVEFPDLPYQYYPILKKLAEPLGKVLGVRPVSDINPRWHPQVLVEIDLSNDLPTVWRMVRDDGIEFNQEIFYKHMPNACFHCGNKGHIIKNCPKKVRVSSQKPPAQTPLNDENPNPQSAPKPPQQNAAQKSPKDNPPQKGKKSQNQSHPPPSPY